MEYSKAYIYRPSKGLQYYGRKETLEYQFVGTWTYHALSERLALPMYAHAREPLEVSRDLTNIILLCDNTPGLWL
jgi:hypothetical protein